MELTFFIQDLTKRGKVTVAGQVIQFSKDDEQEAVLELEQYYQEEVLKMPLQAPAFVPQAALWAARYVYFAIQLAMLRDLEDDTVHSLLTEYPGEVTPEAVYSVDLTFRYLPDLLGLAKGLAPGDVLVENLKKTLRQWPFSSFGTELAQEVDHGVLLQHPSLAYAYIDRIIAFKDKKRVNTALVLGLVKEVLGDYAAVLWPDFIEFTPTS